MQRMQDDDDILITNHDDFTLVTTSTPRRLEHHSLLRPAPKYLHKATLWASKAQAACSRSPPDLPTFCLNIYDSTSYNYEEN